MLVSELIDVYEKHLNEGSQKSVEAFRPIGRVLRATLGTRDHLDVTPAEIKTVLTEATAAYSERTRYVWLSYTRAMWFYPERMLMHEQSPKNPFRANGLRTIFPKPKPLKRQFIIPETLEAMSHTPRTERSRLLLRLFHGTGLRITEALTLEVRDIEDAIAGSNDGRRLIIRKPKSGQEEEYVALPKDLAKDLKLFIRTRGLKPEDRLFPITRQAVRQMVKSAGERFGLKLSPHDLRRAWASTKSRQGVPIGIIQAGLRHKSEETTKGYIAKVGFDELMEMQDQTETATDEEKPKEEKKPEETAEPLPNPAVIERYFSLSGRWLPTGPSPFYFCTPRSDSQHCSIHAYLSVFFRSD